jgi:acetylornithine deacetylase/succinyl-diaminopimelate desuccinylase-like protein
MADVVPVLPATKDLWTHDPFGGEYDGTYIWGRGSSDDKSGLIGIMYVPSQLPKIEELMAGPQSNFY